jgi:hypothetical protein
VLAGLGAVVPRESEGSASCRLAGLSAVALDRVLWYENIVGGEHAGMGMVRYGTIALSKARATWLY